MKKLTILIVMAFYCLYFPAFGQTTTPISNLKVGDKMPGLIITNLLNSKQKTIDLSKLRGKLILLDFWNTTCSACIEGFADLDSLQKVYADKLQVILVNAEYNHESLHAVDAVIKRTKAWSRKGFSLPIVYPDYNLKPYFKFRGVPYTIWIGPDGTIVAMTRKEDITSSNLERAMAGENLNITAK